MAYPKKTGEERENLRDKLTSTIVDKIRSGGLEVFESVAMREAPFNPVTKTRYQGFNWLALSVTQTDLNTRDGRFMTFNNALAQDACVKKGETSSKIIFWKVIDRTKPKPGEKVEAPAEGGKKKPQKTFVLKNYSVFHASQIEGLPERVVPQDRYKNATCDLIMEAFIASGGTLLDRHPHAIGETPCYSPVRDGIYMPPRDAFPKEGAYYATMFHELGHATGHKTRLDRYSDNKYHNPVDEEGRHATPEERRASYHREEFVAELTAAMLCAEFGVMDFDRRLNRSAAYLAGYLDLFGQDPGELYRASTKAKAAVDFTLNQTIDYAIAKGVLQDHPVLAEIAARSHAKEEAKSEVKEAAVDEHQDIGQEQDIEEPAQAL